MKNKKLMKVYLAIIVLIIVSAILYLNTDTKTKEIKSVTTNGTSKPVVITKDNLERYLEGNVIIKDMPKSGRARINFYVNEEGGRKITETYSVEGQDVIRGKGEDEVDAEIYIDEKYLAQAGKGLCSAIKNANNNGELIIELKASEVELLWKYRGLLKHKDCFG